MAFKISEHFTLTKKEKIKENKTTVLFYEHNKTKAKVIYFQNNNESAAFGTFFKTPPTNSKGTPHILEHMVFEGSKNFNQENSLDFIFNNSLTSFANAFTFPDKTMYPFSSSFQKDFLNVMDVYLDIVFFPNLEEKSLKKEGHFFKKNNGSYEFNGIVFNEMKNSLLTFDNLAYDAIKNFFLPDNTYSYNYGGDPVEIVDLEIDELKSFHKEKYHPTNSHTVIYGKINKSKVFSKLNEVFSKFEYEPKDFKISATPIGENKKMSLEYQDLDGDNKFVKYYLLKGMQTEEDFLGIDIFKKYYFDFDFSPLRRIIEDSGICKHLRVDLVEDVKIPVLILTCSGVEHRDIEKLEDLIDSNIYKFSKDIPKETKDLILKRYQYTLKEIEFFQSQGIDTIISVARFINYDLDPLIGLRNYKSLKIIEKLLTGKKFEKFLREKILPSQTLSIKFSPNAKLLEQYNSKIQAKLKSKLEKIDLKELDKQILEHEAYLNQEKIEPNYPQLKKLKIQDLGLKTERFESEINNNIYRTFLNCSNLVRLGLNFDISDFNFSKLEYLGIYIDLVNQLSSKNYTFDKLNFLKKKNLHVFDLDIEFYPNETNSNKLITIFLYLKFLDNDKDEVLNILKELILNLDFNDKERIKFLLSERHQILKSYIYDEPLDQVRRKALSYVSEIEYIEYNFYSLPMLNKLKFILENFESQFEELSNELKLIHSYIFSQNCLFNFGVSKENSKFIKIFSEDLAQELNILPSSISNFGKLKIQDFSYPNTNLSFYLPGNSDTNFNAMAVKYQDFDLSEKHLLKFLVPYLNQYLWDEIRVKNGAYHSSFMIQPYNNSSVFVSFSDPKISETYKVFSNTKTNFNLSKFKKYSFEKMKLRFLSKSKLIYRNEDIYKISFSYFMVGKDFKTRKAELESRIALNFNQLKDLVKSLKNIKFTIKATSTTRERIKDFPDKYETIS